MDILRTLQQKREVHRGQQHPLSSLSLNDRYLYGFGLAILAKGNIKTMEELAVPFETICEALLIPKDTVQEYANEVQQQFDEMLDRLIAFLMVEKKRRFCFLIDLIKLKEYANLGHYYCEEVISYFLSILKLEPEYKCFFIRFLQMAEQGNGDAAHQLVAELEKNYDKIGVELLQYMNPLYVETEEYEELYLTDGGIFRMECPVTVHGDIRVENGSRLYIKNAHLTLGGTLYANNAVVKVHNSTIETTADRSGAYLFRMSNVHRFEVLKSRFLLHQQLGGIDQNSGQLQIQDSEIIETKNQAAIQFSGEQIMLKNVRFTDCKNGGIKLLQKAAAFIEDCRFADCFCEQGGAFYGASSAPVTITGCEFERCRAKYLGDAIYFTYKRYGQEVSDCYFDEMERALFNVCDGKKFL